jgi:hypothetical protein
MKYRNLSVFFLSFWIILQLAAFAQQSQGEQKKAPAPQEATDRSPASASKNDMEAWLTEKDKTTDHLVELGVDRKVAEAFGSGNNSTPLYPKWTFPRTGVKSRFGILFLPCNWAETAYLYALQSTEGAWRVTDKMQLDCHYDDSVSIQIGSIRDPNRDEIMVHHVCGGHGAGYLEQSLSVLLPVQGKLVVELETDEVLRTSPVGGPRHDLVQGSTFAVIPVDSSRSCAIEQTRSSTLNGRLTVQRRIFRWDPVKGRYRPAKFTSVEAAAAS